MSSNNTQIRFLEEKRAILKAIRNDDSSLTKEIIEGTPDLMQEYIISNTCLHIAARDNSVECAKILIELGMDVDVSNDYSSPETPLETAATNGSIEMIRYLVSCGANLEGKSSCTPLISAIIKGDLESVKLLIELGANINVVFKNYEKPLTSVEVAEYWGHSEIVKFLNTFTINANKPDMETYKKERILKKTGFSSLNELLKKDLESPISDDEFDDKVWMILCEHFSSPEEIQMLPKEFNLYFASRYLEWEVGNGGFAQAAYNIPEWFPYALEGYKYFGKMKSVDVIQKAINLLELENHIIQEKGLKDTRDIKKVSEHFQESQMEALDREIDDDEWWITDLRVNFVRDNREVFKQL